MSKFAPSESGALLHAANGSQDDSVINNKYQPSPEEDTETNWVPSSYLWAFGHDGKQIARAITHLRESIRTFVHVHKHNPDVAVIVRKDMNCQDAKEEILYQALPLFDAK